jgi:hypothetical protein
MWPNLLTEAWASAFFQTIIVLLVFALGVPALVLQIGMPTDLQRVAGRGMTNLRMTIILMLFYIFIACSFLWFLHPQSRTVSSSDTLSASLVLTGTLVVTVLFWWHQALENRRERIVERLEDHLSRKARKLGFIPNERSLEDLVYLGANGQRGYEKQLCLSALEKVAEAVQNSDRYAGSSLESVILGLEEVVTSGEAAASDRDLQMCCGILRRLFDFTTAHHSASTDGAATVRSLGRLGRIAACQYSEPTAMMFTQSVSFSSRDLSKIGTEALRSGRYLIALDALSRIEHLATTSADTSHTRYLAGLCSHIWSSKKSLRPRVLQSLERYLYFGSEQEWRQQIKVNVSAYQRIADYETADLILMMIRDFQDSSSLTG